MRKRPVYLHVVAEEKTHTVCSWCGLNVPTEVQQEIHNQWHRALGVVPWKAQSEDDT